MIIVCAKTFLIKVVETRQLVMMVVGYRGLIVVQIL